MPKIKQFLIRDLLAAINSEADKRKSPIEREFFLNRPVFLSRDEEGNGFGEMRGFTSGTCTLILWPMNEREEVIDLDSHTMEQNIVEKEVLPKKKTKGSGANHG